MVHEKTGDVRLVFVGPDDGFRSTLESRLRSLRIADYAIFTGYTDEHEKLAALADSDVFVTPSFSGFPMSFLEAGIAGIPIVTTEKGDKLDWMRQACVVTKYTSNELASSMERLLLDEKYAERLGQKARHLVSQLFDIRKTVDKIERVYQEIMNERPKSMHVEGKSIDLRNSV
jgi:glycosyltransferase involved in cell wall biosynthesis